VDSTQTKSSGSMWIGSYMGIRFQLAANFNFELDYLYKISTFDLDSYTKKHFDYSGSSIRISMYYTFYTKSYKEGSE